MSLDSGIAAAAVALLLLGPGLAPAAAVPRQSPGTALALSSDRWIPAADCPAPARLPRTSAGTVVRFSAPFRAEPDLNRCFWDVPLDADLRGCSGLSLRFRCGNPSAIRHLSVYLKSGAGWYATHFAPSGNRDWKTLRIRKEEMEIEGVPDGWKRISALRFAIWKSRPENTVASLSEVRLRSSNAPVTVVRGDRSAGPGTTDAEIAAARRAARTVTRALRGRGIRPALVESADLDASFLDASELVVLPYAPRLPETAAGALRKHLVDGGRIIGFYTVPSSLEDLLGLHAEGVTRLSRISGDGVTGIRMRQESRRSVPGLPDFYPQESPIAQNVTFDPAQVRCVGVWETSEGATGLPAVLQLPNGFWVTHVLLPGQRQEASSFLFALCAHAMPELWPKASFHAIRTCGGDLQLGSLQQTLDVLRQRSATGAGVRSTLHSAVQQLLQSRRRHAEQRYVEAVERAHAANSLLERVYSATRRESSDEVRVLWYSKAEHPPGADWDALARRMLASGFSTLLLKVPNPALHVAASAPEPTAATLADGGLEGLVDAVNACHRYGLDVHAWLPVFRLEGKVRPSLREKLERTGRLATRRDGTTDKHWLCPSHPHVRQQIRDTVSALAESFDVDGIHLDYIRYAGPSHCFCPVCRAHFARTVGEAPETWPGELPKGALERQWAAFRQQRVDSMVREISSWLREKHPRTVLSAAVFPDPVRAGRVLGQDWRGWVANEWVDALMPMTYERTAAELAHRLPSRPLLLEHTRVRVLPGIGATARNLTLPEIMRQIDVVRAAGFPGFALFQCNAWVYRTVLPSLSTSR